MLLRVWTRSRLNLIPRISMTCMFRRSSGWLACIVDNSIIGSDLGPSSVRVRVRDAFWLHHLFICGRLLLFPYTPNPVASLLERPGNHLSYCIAFLLGEESKCRRCNELTIAFVETHFGRRGYHMPCNKTKILTPCQKADTQTGHLRERQFGDTNVGTHCVFIMFHGL